MEQDTIISFRLKEDMPTFYVASKIFNNEKGLSGFLVGEISNKFIKSHLDKLQSRLGSPTGKKIHPRFRQTMNDAYECSPIHSGQVQRLFLCYTEEKIEASYWLNPASILLALALVILAALYFFIYRFFIGRILSPLYEFLSNISEISTGKILPLTSNSKYPEVNRLIDASNIIGQKLKEFQDGEIERTKNETVAKVASQVAHDIRSPLTSLEYLLRNSESKLVEGDRVIANQSLERISDILSTLSMKGEKSQAGELKEELIETLVKRIVSEKRLEFQKYNNVEITVLSQVPYGTFVLVSKADFYRAMSNLLNNSAEAKIDDQSLRIKIGIFLDNGKCSIIIKDNGKGIPTESISSIFELGVSVDKPLGSGLGLTTARDTIRYCNGTLMLESEPGKGTIIKILLPISPSPSWFENSLSFTQNSVCIIDDDPSIHSVWDEILIGLNLSITHLKSANEFIKWMNLKERSGYYFLFDLELLNSETNGIELIKSYNLQSQATLVTSHFDDEEIQATASAMGIRIIPKDLAAIIPIKYNSLLKKQIVLIDDDHYIHASWRAAADSKDINLHSYTGIEPFLNNQDKFDRDIEIFIDSLLGENQYGEVEAQKIYDLGFKNITLASGLTFTTLPHWIKQSTNKRFPF